LTAAFSVAKFTATEDTPLTLPTARSIAFAQAAQLMPPPVEPGTAFEPVNARRALLIVGSPKTNEPSTSSALGGYLADRLQQRGWETERLTLRASLNRPEGESELLAAVERAGLIRSEWGKSDNNRRARYYKLPRAGRKKLVDETGKWERIVRAVKGVLEARPEEEDA